MNFNLLLAASPILAVAIGGLLLMLAEAFGKPAVLTGAQAGLVSTDAGAGRSDELALGSAVVLFAGALISVALWKVGPENIPGSASLAPYKSAPPINVSAAAKLPSRKYLRAASLARMLPRRRPIMQYTPRDMVSKATKKLRKSPDAASAMAPTVENTKSGKNSPRSRLCSGK